MPKRPTRPIPSLILVSVVLAAVALIGCGGDDDPAGDEAEANVSATAEAALPETITADDATRVELEDRLLTRLEIPNGPDWMVEAFDSLWVKRDDGAVVRVDPATSKIAAEIPPGPGSPSQHLCQGIGASGEAIWSCPPGKEIVRIDPETNEVTATVPINKLPDQGRIVSASDRVWVLTDSGAELTAIDPGDNKPIETVKLDGRCTELASGGSTVWAMCPFDDRVLRIDARSGEVGDTLELAGATNASVSDHLWVGFEGGVAQVDLDTLEVLAVYDVHPRYGGSIFTTPDAVWVREEGGEFLTRIDPMGQRIVEVIKAPELPSGGDVVQIADSVWATAYDDATLVELEASK
jgi:streptogramin lyase